MTAVSEAITRPALGKRGLAALGVVVGGLIILFGNADVKKGENGGLRPAIVTAVIVVVLTAALWGLLLPRVRNHGRTAMILGIVGVVSIVAFWSGVTPVLAAAAVAAAPLDDEHGRGVRVAQGLAAAAALLALIVSIAQSGLV